MLLESMGIGVDTITEVFLCCASKWLGFVKRDRAAAVLADRNIRKDQPTGEVFVTKLQQTLFDEVCPVGDTQMQDTKKIWDNFAGQEERM